MTSSNPNTAEHYLGRELDIFAHAVNWKRYWSKRIRPYLGSRVIEVGAGLGTNTAFLNDGVPKLWECLEPDAAMSERLREHVQNGAFAANVVARRGTVADRSGELVDTIVYIDVLEHIADDRAEVSAATTRLQTGGHLIVLAPAHPRLFSAFDAAIGHYRRYTQQSLRRLTDPRLEVVDSFYLDSIGLVASAANAFLLRAVAPSRAQIRFWDLCMIPVSRITDRLTAGRLGKTVVLVWRKRAR